MTPGSAKAANLRTPPPQLPQKRSADTRDHDPAPTTNPPSPPPTPPTPPNTPAPSPPPPHPHRPPDDLDSRAGWKEQVPEPVAAHDTSPECRAVECRNQRLAASPRRRAVTGQEGRSDIRDQEPPMGRQQAENPTGPAGRHWGRPAPKTHGYSVSPADPPGRLAAVVSRLPPPRER